VREFAFVAEFHELKTVTSPLLFHGSSIQRMAGTDSADQSSNPSVLENFFVSVARKLQSHVAAIALTRRHLQTWPE
jgi:hypothetical protein